MSLLFEKYLCVFLPCKLSIYLEPIFFYPILYNRENATQIFLLYRPHSNLFEKQKTQLIFFLEAVGNFSQNYIKLDNETFTFWNKSVSYLSDTLGSNQVVNKTQNTKIYIAQKANIFLFLIRELQKHPDPAPWTHRSCHPDSDP